MWLKILAGLFVLFAIGHTLGTASPKVVHGPAEASLFKAMQSFRFPIMGFTRSHWEFYRGFALIISVQLVVMAAIAWQLSRIAGRSPKQALPMAITLLVGGIALAVLGWMFFFGAPILMSFLAVVCSAIVVVLIAIGKEAESPESRKLS
jgi:hypothetical protein